ncbi:protein of unknown function [Clostridium cavendishii DSM 21758]|uniref:Zinc-finger n=1 Tax=Clostridium cavendishii DSM 21758 TaxID=1121302 RepID=A0A1M6LZF3_9CLOT|nr:DUF4652 domain-containing protein [Clostridium cavendishii]SHJ76551.1 protein of unknown function [Clostridium cavendishii DSM 21758]
MDCKVFRKNIDKLLDNAISRDMEIKMKEHIESCSSCKRIYEENLEIQKLFKESLAFDDITFKSSRETIIKSIDKDRYGKSKKKRVKFKFMKNKSRIALVATAMFVLAIFPVGYKIYGNSFSAKNEVKKEIVKDTKLTEKSAKNSIKQDDLLLKENDMMKSYKSLSQDFKFDEVVKFKATELKDEPKLKFATPWKEIKNTKYEYSIEGKGENALEEGVGKLFIKGNSTFKSFEVINNKAQKTPIKVIGGTGNYILVIVGNGYGTVAHGGDLYLIDVDKEITTLLYTKNSNKHQIIDGELKENSLNLKVIKFEDDSLNNYTTNNEEINFENIANSYTDENKQKEDGLLGKLGQNSVYDENIFKNYFMGDYNTYHKNKLVDFKNIEAITPDKIIKLDKEVYNKIFDKFINFDYKIYLMEANYKFKNEDKARQGSHFQIVVVGRTNSVEEWKIVDIIEAP